MAVTVRARPAQSQLVHPEPSKWTLLREMGLEAVGMVSWREMYEEHGDFNEQEKLMTA